ncbi:MAG: DinB family protein, partial [Acidobacteriaceae bacterium]
MQPEPWLRNTLTNIDPIRRQILHALELTAEDAALWLDPLTDAQLLARPHNLPPIAFHLRHIARSLDRLLTYAEGNQITPDQLTALKSELGSPNDDPATA